MKITLRWRVLWSVLKDAKSVWIALCGLIGAYFLGWAWSALLSMTLSATLRYTGMFLQLFGMINVAIGLRDMRLLFKMPSVRARTGKGFRGLAAAFTVPKPVSIQGSIALDGLTMAGEVRVSLRAAPGAPLEGRVSLLEKNLDLLRDELDSKVQQLRCGLGEVKQSVQQESQERVDADKRLDKEIQEVAVGGLRLEFVGLFWLILGTLATSVPDEIVRLLK